MTVEASQVVEEYAETIYNISMEGDTVIGARLAERFRVAPPTVTETLKRMTRDGLVEMDAKRQVTLTPKGVELAEAVLRRHRLTERFLVEMLGMQWHQVHEEAHRLEHALSPRVEERLATLLGMPSTCPHGNPIPGMPAPAPTHPFPLDQAPEGATVVVERITEEAEADRRLLEHLWNSDVKPGTRLRIDEVAPWAGTIAMSAPGRGARIVLGLAAAAKIWVYHPN